MATKAYNLAWENMNSKATSREAHYKHGRFQVFVTPNAVGEVYPISTGCGTLLSVYLGKLKVHKDQKRKQPTFVTKSREGYEIHIASSGALSWTSDGEDDPCIPSGIIVRTLFTANPENSREITKRFGKQFETLETLSKEVAA